MMNVGNHSCVAQGFFNWELGDSKKKLLMVDQEEEKLGCLCIIKGSLS